jgi:hypothetical protein
MITQVKIAGINVTSKVLNWNIERPYGDSMASLNLEVVKSISSLVTLTNGQTIEVWRDFGAVITDPDDKLFKGSIEKFDVQGGRVAISAKDQLILAQNTEVTKVYIDTDAQAGVISDIFLDLVNTYTDLTADGTTVQDSGAVDILKKFVCNHNNVFDRLQALAKVLNWQFYYRADTDKVYFEPQGYTSNANTLTVGDEIIKVPKWENDSTALSNTITVIGAKQLTEITEFFNGDGGTVAFTLANTPESIKIWVGAANYTLAGNDYPHKDNANLLEGGVDIVTTSPDFTIDKINKKVTFAVAPGNFTNNVEINYTYNAPIPLRLLDPASIASYGDRQTTATIMDVRDLDDAYMRGSNLLANSKNPKVYAELRVKKHSSLNLQVGQLVPIVDSVNSVDDIFLINRYVFRYPLDYDLLYVGPKEWRLIDQQGDILNRIKKLEEEQFRDQDAVINLIQAQSDCTAVPVSITRIIQCINDSFILGHPDSNGVLGRGIILDDFEVA